MVIMCKVQVFRVFLMCFNKNLFIFSFIPNQNKAEYRCESDVSLFSCWAIWNYVLRAGD